MKRLNKKLFLLFMLGSFNLKLSIMEARATSAVDKAEGIVQSKTNLVGLHPHSDEQFTKLAVTQVKSVQEVDLSENVINVEGMNEIISALHDNKVLKSLKVSYCHIGSSAAAVFFEKVFTNGAVLKSFDLSHNQ